MKVNLISKKSSPAGEDFYFKQTTNLRLSYTNIKHKREAREAEKKDKGCDESFGCRAEACARGCDKGRGEEVEVYDAVIRRKIFLSVE